MMAEISKSMERLMGFASSWVRGGCAVIEFQSTKKYSLEKGNLGQWSNRPKEGLRIKF
jgi:hypothetical protein